MVEGTPESAILVIRLLALVLKGLIGLVILPFKGAYLLGRGGYRLLTWRAPRLVDDHISFVPDDYRSAIQWSVTIEGQTYRITTIEDIPEEHREGFRNRLRERVHLLQSLMETSPADVERAEAARRHAGWY